MVKLLMSQISLVVVSIFTLCYASLETENLGHLNLQPGFAARLYNSSLTDDDMFNDYEERIEYLQNQIFQSDGQLLSQRVITSLDTQRVQYKNNHLFGFYYDPTVREMIVEMSGYIKAPATGQVSMSYELSNVLDCNDEFDIQGYTRYWRFSQALYLNEESGTFNCSLDNGDDDLTEITDQFICHLECSGTGSETDFQLNVVKDRYYFVNFYTAVFGNAFNSKLTFNVDGVPYNLDDYMYYTPEYYFRRFFNSDDVSLEILCPSPRYEIFTPKVFEEPTTIYPDQCPAQSSLSSLSPSSTSSEVLFSSSESSSSVSSISSEVNSVVSSDSIQSGSVVQTGSTISNSDDIISSSGTSSSASLVLSSRSSSISYSLTRSSSMAYESESVSSSSQTTKTSSKSESVTSPSSDAGLKSSLSSTAGNPIYTANSTVSHSEHTIPTSKSTAMASSSSFTSETADGNAILSTATTTESEIDTLTTTTCPETEQPPNTDKTNPSLTSCEETVLPSQESLSNEVTKTTVGPDGVAVTYTECAGCTALQENSSGVSGENNKLSTDTADNAAPAHSTDIVPVKESALISGESAVYSSHSTAVAVQALPGEGQFLTYEPLLLGLSILITFL